MQEWATNLEQLYNKAWAELGDFTHPRAGYAGLVTLATQGKGGPQMRQLVLREVDKSTGLVILHTDSATPKCTEIAANPQVSLMVWNPETQLQIRVMGRAEILGGYAAKKAWAELPFASHGNYGVTPAPGTPIATPHEYERLPDPARLAVISVRVDALDVVHLGRPHHVRAVFEHRDGWAGKWVAP